MGLVTFDEGGGFTSVFDLEAGQEISFSGPGEIEAVNAPIKQPTASFDPALIYPPEVLAGLNPVAVETVFTDPEKTQRLIEIARTREGNEIDAKLSEVENRLGPEVVSGLNQTTLARVALTDSSREQFLQSIDTRPAFEEPSILDRISNPIAGALDSAQQDVKQAVVVFGIILIAVVVIVAWAALR